MDKKKLVMTAMSAFIALAASTNALADSKKNKPADMERCYGIARAGMNDCATSTASCASSATKDRQADAFIFTPKGLCTRIAGGSLTANNGEKK